MKSLLKKSVLVLALLGSFSQVSADQSYVYQNTEIKSKDGKIAKIFVGVPVEIKKTSDKDVDILIKGFKFGNEVYSSKTKELLVAKLDEGFKVNKKGEEVEITGKLSKELISKDTADIWAEQEEFYFEMCTQCHAAHKIKEHTMNEWAAIMGTMKVFAKLDKDEEAYLLRYLQANSSNGLIKNK